MAGRTGMSGKIVALLENGFTGTVDHIASELRVKRTKVAGNMYRLEKEGKVQRIRNTKPLVYKGGGNGNGSLGRTRNETQQSFAYNVTVENGKTTLSFHTPVQLKTTENGLIISHTQ